MDDDIDLREDNYDDLYEEDGYFEENERERFDLDLLLSVAGGLGRFQYTEDGKKVYEKDQDCIGEHLGAGGW